MIKTIIREEYPKIFTEGDDKFYALLTFDIGFINPYIESYRGDGIANDETELDAASLEELVELYEDFCKENGFPTDTVKYVEIRHYCPYTYYQTYCDHIPCEPDCSNAWMGIE